MKRSSTLFAAIALLLSAGCEQAIEPGGGGTTTGADDDPLAVSDPAPPGSLDALHKDIVLKSCAAQPGLCHHGQFEPNLSTPALMYENLVLKPGIEHDKEYRIEPGAPDKSLVVDKLRNKNVLSQMPLGAEPLPEDEIKAIEKWILDGALRRPGAEPTPKLNNPPAEPEIAIFDDQGNRLDKAGTFSVAAGTKLVLRHSAQDFETDDAAIPYAAFLIQLPDGRSLKLSDTPGSETTAVTTYEMSGAPQGKGDVLDFRVDWTVPATATIIGKDGSQTQESLAGVSLTLLCFYIDSVEPKEGMLTFSISPGLVQVSP